MRLLGALNALGLARRPRKLEQHKDPMYFAPEAIEPGLRHSG
jgi:hypothetical protein